MTATEATPEYRAEIRRVFQVANRRIQNIKNAELLSTAVEGLARKTDVYSVFSPRGLSWNELKIEYSKAVNFLRQPTSTAGGTREYNQHLMAKYDLTQQEFDLMAKSLNDKLTSIDDVNFVERYLMRYKDFTGELEMAAADVSKQIESEAISLRSAIDSKIESETDETLSAIEAEQAKAAALGKAFNFFEDLANGIGKGIVKGLTDMIDDALDPQI